MEKSAAGVKQVRERRGKRKQPPPNRKKCGSPSLKESSATEPSKEWLVREGEALTEAATAEGFQFLSAASGSTELADSQPSAFLETIATTPRDWVARSRPCKAKAKDASANDKKQAEKDVLKLIGS